MGEGVRAGRALVLPVAAVMAILLTAGCGDPSATAVRDAADLPAEIRPEVTVMPSGSEIAPGFVVPPGAQLVGVRFPRPGGGPEVSAWAAVLELARDSNPFGVWDDLVGQARKAGAAVPGSGACRWMQVELADAASGSARALPEGVTSGRPRPEGADTLECAASANGPSGDGQNVSVLMRLWWSAWGAEVGIEYVEAPGEEPPYSYPSPDPGSAPAAAVDDLPPRKDEPLPAEGEPFGRENNCFERGYERLVVPAGARVVGGGRTPALEDFAAVLAVDDARSVLEALRDQLDEPDDSSGSYSITSEDVGGGRSVFTLSGGVSAGGGACTMWSNPEGTAVLVTTHSD